jgi:hypothetical protein
MYKVFAFLKRNTELVTHDEYRAGHVGYHCGHSRRLKGIRGYLVNIWSNNDLRQRLGPLYDEITRNEPVGFLDLWDGFPQVYFDSWDTWSNAATAEPNRATEEGLAVDPDWRLDDGPYLFDVIEGGDGEFRSHHLHMHEHRVLPVERPEHKITKLMQFFRRNPAIPEAAFQSAVLGRYAYLTARLRGLHGYTINFRDSDPEAAMRGFFADTSWGFSAAGRAHRQSFCALWDGAGEIFVDSVADFATARTDPELNLELLALERHLFEAIWYVEVDENVIVMPNRDPAPTFYYR